MSEIYHPPSLIAGVFYGQPFVRYTLHGIFSLIVVETAIIHILLFSLSNRKSFNDPLVGNEQSKNRTKGLLLRYIL